MPPSDPRPLPPDRLYRRANPAALTFTTTAELAPVPDLIDQPRAREAIGIGTCINRPGFNIFAAGNGSGRIQDAVLGLLKLIAVDRPAPSDWVYAHNFETPTRPVAFAAAAGQAQGFARALHALVEELKTTLPALFEGEEHEKRKAALVQSIQAQGQQALAALSERATAQGLAILRTPMGFTMAPARDGKVVEPAAFNAWPQAEREAVEQAIEALGGELEEALRSLARMQKTVREAVRALERETLRDGIAQPLRELRDQFAGHAAALRHVDAIAADLEENIGLFTGQDTAPDSPVPPAARVTAALERYALNVLVSQAEHGAGAPVIHELHPTLGNLVGRVEYLPTPTGLVTHFRLIKPGALHRANGGILVLDARALLLEPFSWPALKRALQRRQIVIEDAGRFTGMAATVSLDPDPIPLDVKIVLYGDRALYFALAQGDPDFASHFKLLADFDDDIDRTTDGEAMLARMIADLARADGLLPLDQGAAARMIEQAARLADDQGKLSLLTERMRDFLAEADFGARAANRTAISRDDIHRAIERHRLRGDRIRARGQEMILNDVALVATSGAVVGQINGLSVTGFADIAFGRPARITCRVRPGAGRILDIEREVELGGPLHSKGVLILTGFLGGRFAQAKPLSLAASLVFEQSYGGVDGDSASSTELYALLSALAELPLRQDTAVTGSVNQHGVVQAIGGVNEKIEGFFDICASRGLTGSQGVMIPLANTRHLMLREDVVAACAAGRFAIWPIETIDQGIALLTGQPAGERGADGLYPENSVNRRVEDRLAAFAAIRQAREAEERR